jgi:hypothetical protein
MIGQPQSTDPGKFSSGQRSRESLHTTSSAGGKRESDAASLRRSILALDHRCHWKRSG